MMQAKHRDHAATRQDVHSDRWMNPRGQEPELPAADLSFPRHRWTSGKTVLSYHDEGPHNVSNQRPTVLLLHGSPMSSFMWRSVIHRLRPSYRVLAVDLPGFGASRTPLVPRRAFSAGAEILAEFLEELDLKNLVLVTHATAGPMGLGAALHCPDRISGLVIANSFGWALRQSPNPVGRMARLVSSSWFSWLVVNTGLLGWVTSRKSRRTGPYDPREQNANSTPLREPTVRRHLINVLRSIAGDESFLSALPEQLENHLGQVPTLLTFGAHDNGYHAGFPSRWRSVFENSRTVVLPESGHFLLEDEPDAWNQAFLEFLESVQCCQSDSL